MNQYRIKVTISDKYHEDTFYFDSLEEAILYGNKDENIYFKKLKIKFAYKNDKDEIVYKTLCSRKKGRQFTLSEKFKSDKFNSNPCNKSYIEYLISEFNEFVK